MFLKNSMKNLKPKSISVIVPSAFKNDLAYCERVLQEHVSVQRRLSLLRVSGAKKIRRRAENIRKLNEIIASIRSEYKDIYDRIWTIVSGILGNNSRGDCGHIVEYIKNDLANYLNEFSDHIEPLNVQRRLSKAELRDKFELNEQIEAVRMDCDANGNVTTKPKTQSEPVPKKRRYHKKEKPCLVRSSLRLIEKRAKESKTPTTTKRKAHVISVPNASYVRDEAKEAFLYGLGLVPRYTAIHADCPQPISSVGHDSKLGVDEKGSIPQQIPQNDCNASENRSRSRLMQQNKEMKHQNECLKETLARNEKRVVASHERCQRLKQKNDAIKNRAKSLVLHILILRGDIPPYLK